MGWFGLPQRLRLLLLDHLVVPDNLQLPTLPLIPCVGSGPLRTCGYITTVGERRPSHHPKHILRRPVAILSAHSTR